MEYQIIDFHTHPYNNSKRNLCHYKEGVEGNSEDIKGNLLSLGVKKICGSVIEFPEFTNIENFSEIKALNDSALCLADKYKGFYVPGFHIHPSFVKESIQEIERMHSFGVNLIGELVPYLQHWGAYYDRNLAEILEAVAHYKMVFSFHSDVGKKEQKQIDAMIKAHRDVVFVAAHPGEKMDFLRHLERMERSENYYLDLSGTGIFRHGLLRYGIDRCGAERFLFGSDYPICNIAAFIGGIANDYLLTEVEKQKIFYYNASKLLGL